jgi:hypothetical protein
MVAHLNITLDEALYERLKEELPAKGISSFIEAAVREKLRPSTAQLDAAYRTASKEPWRKALSKEWSVTEGEAWPE